MKSLPCDSHESVCVEVFPVLSASSRKEPSLQRVGNVGTTQQQWILASVNLCSNRKQKAQVNVYLIIFSEWTKTPLRSKTREDFCPVNVKIWLLSCGSGVVGAADCVTQYPSIRPSFAVMSECLPGEPGSLSVSAREASSPLLSWVLLNARMRSIRDSGLQRL